MEHVVLEGGVGTRLLGGVWEKDRWLQRGCLFPPHYPSLSHLQFSSHLLFPAPLWSGRPEQAWPVPCWSSGNRPGWKEATERAREGQGL